jgi:hypothetical protein
MRKRLIIHIGLYKTGSTALQAFLAQNVSVLASSGIAYPFIVQRDDGGSGIAIGNIWLELIRLRQKYGSACSTDEMVELFLGEAIGNAIAESSLDTVLLSCEHLCSDSALRIIGSFAVVHDVSVIAYVRDPYDLYVSRWKQRVKSQGEAAPFDAWLALWLRESEKSLFAILREFAAPPITLILISYDLHKERLVESFLQRIGVDPSRCNTEPYKGATHNRSLSYEQAMLVTMALQNGALSKCSAGLLEQFMSSPAAFSDPTIHELDERILAKEAREILFLNTVLPAGEKLRTSPRPAIAQSEISFSSENVSRTIRTLGDHFVKAGLAGTRVASPVAHPGLPSDFDAEEYLLRNPDVAMAGTDAEAHYINHGRWENRVYRARSTEALAIARSVSGGLSTSGIVHQAFREPSPLQVRQQAGRKPLRHWLADLLQRAVGRLSRRGKW